MSYANMALYSSVIPSHTPKKREQEYDESKDANNPDNFKSDEDEVVVRA